MYKTVVIDGDLNLDNHLEGEYGTYTKVRELPPSYDGGYTVTPSDSAQVLDTAGKLMAENLTVEAIPSNYGLITWDGATLTVS